MHPVTLATISERFIKWLLRRYSTIMEKIAKDPDGFADEINVPRHHLNEFLLQMHTELSAERLNNQIQLFDMMGDDPTFGRH